jgi:hypothetical protein
MKILIEICFDCSADFRAILFSMHKSKLENLGENEECHKSSMVYMLTIPALRRPRLETGW